MKDVINVDKILKYLAEEIADQFGGDYDDNPNPDEEQRAKASLHSLLISKLPEKKPTNSAFEERRLSTPESVQNSAYNSAIDDMHQVIDKLIKEKK